MARDAGWKEMKQYAVYKTASAPVSRTIGAIALAIALTAFVAKRFGLVDADVFVLSLTCAAILAIVAIVAALAAFQRIWSYGGPGVSEALIGTFFGVLALVPPSIVIGTLVASPGANDISTDKIDPPELKSEKTASSQPFLNWATVKLEENVWPLVSGLSISPSSQGRDLSRNSADIVPRRYRIAPGQLHVAGAKALENLNWTVVDELPPDLLDAATRLQAEGVTRYLGLKFDVALRIRPDQVGALLDVRSRSRTPLQDLSTNAGQIRTVFAEIDRVLLETYGDLARLSVEEGELEDELTPEIVEDPREVVPLPGFKPYFGDDELSAPDDPDATDLEG